MATINKKLVFVGVVTLFQAAGQLIYTTLGLLQYFCVIDFLKELPLLIFLKILYFHKPGPCGVTINIGQSIEGMANQAFVLLTREPFTATRTFIINAIGLGLSVPWLCTCVGLTSAAAKNNVSKSIRWLWLCFTVAISSLDLVAAVTYANDTFHTRTLLDIMDFIGGTASGTGGTEVNTSWASWVMVIVYSRFIFLFFLNIFFIMTVIIIGGATRDAQNTGIQVGTSGIFDDSLSIEDVDEESTNWLKKLIPRPVFNYAFWRKKARSSARIPSIVIIEASPYAIDVSPEISPPPQRLDIDDKKQVNFPENVVFNQRLENLIGEQQRRLDSTVIDTSGRVSPPRASQSLPQLAYTSNQESRGRRGTAAELQSQLPWSYVPSSALRMRDQLPPDEDLPPVPLPDYTAITSFRKASVHRAASSLSSLNQKRQRLTRQADVDVLY